MCPHWWAACLGVESAGSQGSGFPGVADQVWPCSAQVFSTPAQCECDVADPRQHGVLLSLEMFAKLSLITCHLVVICHTYIGYSDFSLL